MSRGPPSTVTHPLPTLLTVPGAQEDEEPEESGCEEEDEDSGSEESLVDSDSDPEEKGACSGVGCPGRGCSWVGVPGAGCSWAGCPGRGARGGGASGRGCLPRRPRETARGSGCPGQTQA